jgi:hypothetical protein
MSKQRKKTDPYYRDLSGLWLPDFLRRTKPDGKRFMSRRQCCCGGETPPVVVPCGDCVTDATYSVLLDTSRNLGCVNCSLFLGPSYLLTQCPNDPCKWEYRFGEDKVCGGSNQYTFNGMVLYISGNWYVDLIEFTDDNDCLYDTIVPLCSRAQNDGCQWNDTPFISGYPFVCFGYYYLTAIP